MRASIFDCVTSKGVTAEYSRVRPPTSAIVADSSHRRSIRSLTTATSAWRRASLKMMRGRAIRISSTPSAGRAEGGVHEAGGGKHGAGSVGKGVESPGAGGGGAGAGGGWRWFRAQRGGAAAYHPPLSAGMAGGGGHEAGDGKHGARSVGKGVGSPGAGGGGGGGGGWRWLRAQRGGGARRMIEGK